MTSSNADRLQTLGAMLKNVEVEVNSRCNRKCVYCPVSVLPIPDAPRHMPEHIFDRLVEELEGIDYAGRISYHFYNEPLLRKDLERLMEKVKGRLPRAHQIIFTNGDLLTDRRYESLRAAGAEFIVVTSHDGKPHPARPNQYVQYPPDLELTNRGGTMHELPTPTDETRRTPCYAPSEMLIVTASGDVLLCYEDAERRHEFGNIMESTLADIWFADELVRAREQLARGERVSASAICAVCTNCAHAEPGLSARSEPFWAELAVNW